MNPDIILIAIPFAGGVITGAAIGCVYAAKTTARLLVRKERETWLAASKFHAHQGREVI